MGPLGDPGGLPLPIGDPGGLPSGLAGGLSPGEAGPLPGDIGGVSGDIGPPPSGEP